MVDLTPFNEGIEAAKKTIYVYDGDPRDGFANELQSAGYRLDSPIIVGKLQRISDPNDKGKKRTGWYVYHEIDDSQNEGGCIGVGKYGSWRGDDQHTWTSRSVSRMSARERMSYNAQIEQLKAQRELEQQNIWNEAAARAQEIYNKFNLPIRRYYVILYPNFETMQLGDILICMMQQKLKASHSLLAFVSQTS